MLKCFQTNQPLCDSSYSSHDTCVYCQGQLHHIPRIHRHNTTVALQALLTANRRPEEQIDRFHLFLAGLVNPVLATDCKHHWYLHLPYLLCEEHRGCRHRGPLLHPEHIGLGFDWSSNLGVDNFVLLG